MSSHVGLGVPFPKLLPIVGTWTAPFALYELLLAARVARLRVGTSTFWGQQSRSTPSTDDSIDPLTVAVRGHGNFLEYIPLALVFAGVAELNGASKSILNYSLGALFAFRLMHNEFGLRWNKQGVTQSRTLGFLGTQVSLVGLAGWSLYLVKGYWGY